MGVREEDTFTMPDQIITDGVSQIFIIDFYFIIWVIIMERAELITEFRNS